MSDFPRSLREFEILDDEACARFFRRRGGRQAVRDHDKGFELERGVLTYQSCRKQTSVAA